jgi:tRNA/tmRNA/rRNA uracil-C5-methylase (TrmA/RlmC/RlmD family)
VVKTNRLPDLSWFSPGVADALGSVGVEALWVHLNPSTGKRVFAKRDWHLVWGRPRSVTPTGFMYGPTSFSQLVPSLHTESLDTAEAFLAPAPGDLVIDLYAGIGLSLSRWDRRGARTIGVEISREAVDCARYNVPGALVLRGSCRDRIPQLNDWSDACSTPGSRRFLYANPPRTGLEPEILDWATACYRPDRIVMLSCSAGTLSRDLQRLEQSGYCVERLAPYDFFPQTHHVETAAFLQRNG